MNKNNFQPLAARIRPQRIEDFVGQKHLLDVGKPLRRVFDTGVLHSMIFWGPPGSGKTTLARLIAHYTHAQFERISAVTSGVKDIRNIMDLALKLQVQGRPTILFVDEIHRFNKAQQDAFLPYIEDGTLILIGATTENPSFELNNALLSRARVYVLKALEPKDLLAIIDHALSDCENGFGVQAIDFPQNLRELLIEISDGDARRVLSLLELAVDIAETIDHRVVITDGTLKKLLGPHFRRFDHKGENFYDQISALHKSVRGSSPDAALYWLARMLDGGCDPLYIARRTVRMASEDIGNADPRALELALNAWDVYERLGSPEGELAIAQALVYMACAPKSNAVYTAFHQAVDDVKRTGSLEVPLHLRNAPTKLMKELGYGREYRYAHDEPDAYAAGEHYFPDKMKAKRYYYPVNRGLEIKIAEKLEQLRKLEQEKKDLLWKE